MPRCHEFLHSTTVFSNRLTFVILQFTSYLITYMTYEQHFTGDSDKYQGNQTALSIENPQASYTHCSD